MARLAPVVGVWQSVSRVEEGERIAHFAPGAAVLVQVDTTGLSGRNGCPPERCARSCHVSAMPVSTCAAS